MPIDHATIQRGVGQYSSLLAEAWHRRKRPGWVSWRLDETSLTIKGQWYDLYRAVDTQGQTIDFLGTEQRGRASRQAVFDHSDPPAWRAREHPHRRECGP